MELTIKKAIEQAQLLKIWYDNYERIIAPHALGYGSQGQLLLRAYQHAGGSSSGNHVGWKLFRVDRLIRCQYLIDPAGPVASGYKKGDRVMKQGILAER